MTLWLHDSYLKSSAHVTWNVISALRGHGIFHDAVCDTLPSVLWRCWLGGRKGIRPVKNFEWCSTGVVICLERYADLHMAQLMPLPLTVSCFSKIQIGFNFLVPAHPGSPGHRAVKRVCVCVYAWCNVMHWVDGMQFICFVTVDTCTKHVFYFSASTHL